jgi:hypothetical protein
MGAAATGLVPTLLRMANNDMPPISLEATVWTKCMQSFMDPKNYYRAPLQTRGPNGQVHIPRQDEMRLLYITDVDSRRYASPPLGPWPPPGTVELGDTQLEVQQHLNCAHRPLYKQWNWELANERIESDPGLTVVKPTLRSLNRLARWLAAQLPRKPSYSLEGTGCNDGCDGALSRSATRSVFQWSLPDGIKSNDKVLWQNEWLVDLLSDDS